MRPLALAALCSALLASCSSRRPEPSPEPSASASPPAVAAPVDPAMSELGRELFFDPRLSASGELSCSSCHDPARAFTDGRAVSLGHRGAKGRRSSPSLLDVAERAPYFWDGRAATLEEQALGPLADPSEMAQDLAALEARLEGIAAYAERFRAVFSEGPVTRENLARALAAYERTLSSRPARFDRFDRGDRDALTEAEARGYRLFTGKAECATCHKGPLLTDNGFHGVGLRSDDAGRFEVEPVSIYRGSFKTPSLRHVAATAPYFHDGSAATLEEVVEHYAKGGDEKAAFAKDIHPLELSADEKAELVAFLRTLE